MSGDLVMPKLGLTMSEGVVSQWLCQPGTRFATGDILLVVETDKIANEIEAPESGVMGEILVPEGGTAAVGAPIARWQLDKAAANGEGVTRPPVQPAGEAPQSAPQIRAVPTSGEGPRLLATPLARRLARDGGIDLSNVRGSGPRGRIKACDVMRATEGTASAELSPETSAQAEGGRIAPTAYQRSAARRLTAAKRDTPHFYLSTEMDAGPLLDLRKQFLETKLIDRLTLTPFFLLAMARALGELPEANRVWADDQILQFETVDIGVAVNSDAGLFVPVLRKAGEMGLKRLAGSLAALAESARAGRLRPEDVGGGATTLSNGGMFDVTYMSSIINPGQSSILGVGSVRSIFRPDSAGQPSLRREIGLVLSCDHRIFDGSSGLRFLNRIKKHLEQPMGLLLN